MLFSVKNIDTWINSNVVLDYKKQFKYTILTDANRRTSMQNLLKELYKEYYSGSYKPTAEYFALTQKE